jgi:putative ABC transport system permease protein
MIKNYLKIAFRNLFIQRLFTIINVTGLAIGISCAIIIGLYVSYEKSYDRFHSKYDRIFRIYLTGKIGSNEFKGPVSPSPMAQTLINEFPEVESAVRLFPVDYIYTQALKKTYYEEKFVYADSSFFDIFSFNFIQGSPYFALKDSNSVVINRSIAIKYFGNVNSIGKNISIKNADSSCILKITGIIEDMPANSHFHFNFICNSKVLKDAENTYWINTNNYTYITIKEGNDYKNIETKLPNLVNKHVVPQIRQFYSLNEDTIPEYLQYNFHLQKLTDIHLNSTQDYELETPGNRSYINIFLLVAIFLIIIASINFVNLSTAHSTNRSKEIGVRKAMGASKFHIIHQILIETIVLCFIAVVIALLICELTIPLLNNALDLNLKLEAVHTMIMIILIVAISLLLGIFAGIFPALHMSKFKAVVALKSQNQRFKGSFFRSALVIIQFTISITIILCTMVIYNQLYYINSKELGYNSDKLIVIEKSESVKKHINLFIKDLKNTPFVQDVTLSSNIPGRPYLNSGFVLEGAKEKLTYYFSFVFADYSYLNVMGLKIINGRYFSEKEKSDNNAIIINESAVKYLGIKDPVGKTLISTAPEESKMTYFKIIGIVKDFHFEDFHKPIRPVILMLSKNASNYISIKIPKGKNGEALNYISAVWKKYSNGAPLQYLFLNKEFAKLYDSEHKIKFTMTVFSLLAIFVACLGLFALVAFKTEKRTKETGIRKALGASAFKIITLFTWETVYLLIIASVLSIVISWYLMEIWLNTFAYHIELNLFAFVGTCILALIIAVSAVLYQAYSAAVKNPVEAIRYE